MELCEINMKISVITICFNAEKEIERTIRSVLNQTYLDLEYIIVDGASKDGTVSVAKSIIKEYPNRTVHLISEKDKGIYDAMNKGIKKATGEWVNMMNAGDVFTDEFVLEKVFSNTINDNIYFLYSDVYKATSFGKNFVVRMFCNEHARHLIHQVVIYRKKLHEQVGYYIVTPKIIVSDYLFFLQVPIEQIKKVDTIIAIYEGNGVSESGEWCIQQALCAEVVFRHRSFWSVYQSFVRWKLKHMIPRRVREYIRLNLIK